MKGEEKVKDGRERIGKERIRRMKGKRLGRKKRTVKHCHLSVRKISLRFHYLVPLSIQQRRLEETQKIEVDVLMLILRMRSNRSSCNFILRCHNFICVLSHIVVKLLP